MYVTFLLWISNFLKRSLRNVHTAIVIQSHEERSMSCVNKLSHVVICKSERTFQKLLVSVSEQVNIKYMN